MCVFFAKFDSCRKAKRSTILVDKNPEVPARKSQGRVEFRHLWPHFVVPDRSFASFPLREKYGLS